MKYLVLIIVLVAPLFSMAQSCVPNVDSCGFYICEENRHQCGSQGYPLAFGFRFCQNFLRTEHKYSPEAHAWLRRVRVCLMESFQGVNGEQPKACDRIREDSFRSHIGCYERTGFCNLSNSDQLHIFWALRASFIFPEAIRDGVEVMKLCAFKTAQNRASQDEPK